MSDLLEQQNPDLRTPPATDHGLLPNLKFSFSHAHTRRQDGGWAREVTPRELPVATADLRHIVRGTGNIGMGEHHQSARRRFVPRAHSRRQHEWRPQRRAADPCRCAERYRSSS